MKRVAPRRRLPLWAGVFCACYLTCLGAAAAQMEELPAPAPVAEPEPLTLPAAVEWALRNNPTLAAQRQAHGIAAAQVVIANTYPFNPVLENRFQLANGPISAGITNRLPLEHILVWEVEILGQGTYRRQEATAALTRTDWQIAYQEQLLAVRVLRAFTTVVYRREKLRLLEETLRLNEQLVQDVSGLMKAGRLRGADLILAQTEAVATGSLIDAGREALVLAEHDLRMALGVVGGPVPVDGTLALPPLGADRAGLLEAALERRADVHALRAAVAEAEAALRLTRANRYGNPAVGPAYTYDPTRINLIGAQVNVPLPFCNTHRGDILKGQAEHTQALLNLREAEVTVRQEVLSALDRLEAARAREETIRSRILPALQRGLEGLKKLFLAAEPGVDVLRVIDVQRKLIQARDGHLDALYSIVQARADLVAAVGATPAAVACFLPPPPPARAELLPPPE